MTGRWPREADGATPSAARGTRAVPEFNRMYRVKGGYKLSWCARRWRCVTVRNASAGPEWLPPSYNQPPAPEEGGVAIGSPRVTPSGSLGRVRSGLRNYLRLSHLRRLFPCKRLRLKQLTFFQWFLAVFGVVGDTASPTARSYLHSPTGVPREPHRSTSDRRSGELRPANHLCSAATLSADFFSEVILGHGDSFSSRRHCVVLLRCLVECGG